MFLQSTMGKLLKGSKKPDGQRGPLLVRKSKKITINKQKLLFLAASA